MEQRPASDWIEHLNLLPHPEGGFYRETYRSRESVSGNAMPEHFTGSRNFSTGIYFLLRSQDRSVFHRIKSDEMWHFYAGVTLSIFILSDSGLKIKKLGTNLTDGEYPQVVVPAGAWFGAKVLAADNYVLAGCTVSPGFDFADFEMANREYLIGRFPDHKDLIIELT